MREERERMIVGERERKRKRKREREEKMEWQIKGKIQAATKIEKNKE